MERAFIIGNGKSRIGFDLNQLRGKGTIYGCNALYRDFMPDVLIATDDRMREEIELSEINPDVQKNIPKEIPFPLKYFFQLEVSPASIVTINDSSSKTFFLYSLLWISNSS